MTSILIPHQCRWCSPDGTFVEQACQPCGSDFREGRCRAPQWERLRVSITANHSQYNVTTNVFRGFNPCCGEQAVDLTALNVQYPFLQWGYWRHRRSKLTETWKVGQQDRDLGANANFDGKDMWRYRLFRTQSNALVWHYWFKLDQYRIRLFPLFQYGQCMLRLAFTVHGTHFLSQRIVQEGDTRPNTGCHQVGTDTGLSGVEFGEYFSPTPCDGSPYGFPACPNRFEGTNPNSYIMSWYTEKSWEDPSTVPLQVPFTHTYCIDLAAPLTTTPINLYTIATGCATPCGAPNSVLVDPAFSFPNWVPEDVTTPGPTCYFPSTLGVSPYAFCVPPPNNGPFIQRFHRECQEVSTRFVETKDGSNPDATINFPDFSQWILTFSES